MKRGLRVVAVSALVMASGGNHLPAASLTTLSPAPVTLSLTGIMVQPSTITAGDSARVVVTLSAAAPAGGTTITLSGDDSLASVPGNVVVAAGQTRATFTILSNATITTSASIHVRGSLGRSKQSATVIVTPFSHTEDVNAILARCPTAEEVAASDRDLVLSFEDDPTAGAIVCTAGQSSKELTLLQAQVYRVLTIMRRLTFDAPLPWTSTSLYGWFIASTHGIRFRQDINTSVAGDPINIQTRNFIAVDPRHSQDFRWVGALIGLLVHEARHNNGFLHGCPDHASDQTLYELGAWGVQYYTNLFLGSHSDPKLIPPAPCTGCGLDTRASFVRDAELTCVRFCWHDPRDVACKAAWSLFQPEGHP